MCLNPRRIKIDPENKIHFSNLENVYGKEYLIDCGQCLECQKKYSRSWLVRLLMEFQDYKDKTYFITLTYNDDYCPVSLNKRDVQLFLKRLRKEVGKFRYFLVGEYGGTTFRPHYHLIIFGIDFYKYGASHFEIKNGNQYFSSKLIEKIWDKGFNFVSKCFSGSSFAYVCQYANKKLGRKKADKRLLRDHDIIPEFVLMSRKPGIGYNFYKRNEKDIENNGYVIFNGQKYYLPRYFKKLINAKYQDDEYCNILYENIYRDFDLFARLNDNIFIHNYNYKLKYCGFFDRVKLDNFLIQDFQNKNLKRKEEI